MSGLRVLKNKINTVKSIKKIFSVMQLIATSKMKKAQEAINSSNQVIETIKELLLRAIDGDGSAASQLAPVNTEAPMLYVVFSSDRGLCGNYNNIIIKKVTEILTKVKNPRLIIVGNKALTFFARKCAGLIDLRNSMKFDDMRKDEEKIVNLLNNIFLMYRTGEISSCKIVFVRSKNAMSKEIAEVNLFNLDELSNLLSDENSAGKDIFDNSDNSINQNDSSDESNKAEEQASNLYEANKQEVIKYLIDYYLKTKFFNFFKSAYFSELASRMVAMDNASRNSNEIQKALTLKYNKKRQEIITRDLIDIINGSENA